MLFTVLFPLIIYRHYTGFLKSSIRGEAYVPNHKIGRPDVVTQCAKILSQPVDSVLENLKMKVNEDALSKNSLPKNRRGELLKSIGVNRVDNRTASKVANRLDLQVQDGYDQNEKRKEGLLDIYNQISHIVACRAAFGFLDSTTPEGKSADENYRVDPRKIFNIDASSHYLGSESDKMNKKHTKQQVLVTPEVSGTLKSNNLTAGYTSKKGEKANTKRSIKYIYLVNYESSFGCITIIKDKCFIKPSRSCLKVKGLEKRRGLAANEYFLVLQSPEIKQQDLADLIINRIVEPRIRYVCEQFDDEAEVANSQGSSSTASAVQYDKDPILLVDGEREQILTLFKSKLLDLLKSSANCSTTQQPLDVGSMFKNKHKALSANIFQEVLNKDHSNTNYDSEINRNILCQRALSFIDHNGPMDGPSRQTYAAYFLKLKSISASAFLNEKLSKAFETACVYPFNQKLMLERCARTLKEEEMEEVFRLMPKLVAKAISKGHGAYASDDDIYDVLGHIIGTPLRDDEFVPSVVYDDDSGGALMTVEKQSVPLVKKRKKKLEELQFSRWRSAFIGKEHFNNFETFRIQEKEDNLKRKLLNNRRKEKDKKKKYARAECGKKVTVITNINDKDSKSQAQFQCCNYLCCVPIVKRGKNKTNYTVCDYCTRIFCSKRNCVNARLLHVVLCESIAKKAMETLKRSTIADIDKDSLAEFHCKLQERGLERVPRSEVPVDDVLLHLIVYGIYGSIDLEAKVNCIKLEIINEFSDVENNKKRYYEEMYDEFCPLTEYYSFEEMLRSWRSPGDIIQDELLISAAATVTKRKIVIFASDSDDDFEAKPFLLDNNNPRKRLLISHNSPLFFGKYEKSYMLLREIPNGTSSSSSEENCRHLQSSLLSDNQQTSAVTICEKDVQDNMILSLTNLGSSCFLNVAVQLIFKMSLSLHDLEDEMPNLDCLSYTCSKDEYSVLQEFYWFVKAKYVLTENRIYDTTTLYEACGKVKPTLFSESGQGVQHPADEAVYFLLARCEQFGLLESKQYTYQYPVSVFTCSTCLHQK